MITTDTRPRIEDTSESFNQYVRRWIAVNGKRSRLMNEAEILREAVYEKYSTGDITAVLEDAELNSIRAWRDSDNRPGSKSNPFIDTHVQGDLFFQYAVKTPAILMVDGAPKPYTEADPFHIREFWVGYEQHRRQESDAASAQAEEATRRANEALAVIASLDSVIAVAESSGIDPRTLRLEKKA